MATNFESHTHQQLLAMLASANAETLKTRGAQLTDAAATIKEIGESLKDHRVTGWEGESATAFQDWVSRTGNATLRLSEYSAEGGKQLTQASQVVIEVKANMPTYDSGAAANLEASREYRNDPDAAQIGQQAHSKLSGDRQQAIQQMTKLAQGYEASATGMEMAEIPTFPKWPEPFIPPPVAGYGDVERSGGTSPGATGGAAQGAVGGASQEVVGAGGSSYAPPPAGPGGSPPGSGSAPGPQPSPAPVPVPPDRNIGTGLDNVGPAPSTTLPPAPGAPGSPGPVGPGGGGSAITPGGFVPPVTLPPGGGVQKPIGGGGPGSFGPGGTIPGAGGIGGKGGGLGGVAGLPPRDSGISGGRPVTPSGPGASIPRGTVIGGEGAQTAGRGMGMGGGGAQGGLGNPMAGRRLATEPGGVVGGRQSGVGGRSIAGGQPFTQGGSGLVRGGSGAGPMAGPMGHGAAGAPASGRRGDGRQGERPDYLAEDEETWQGDGRVVPPVID
ncbi:WXG100 family type VII secretion target [Streptomyces sp. NPDC059956]|uniref:WXG100 family type VII secretion target n=1 Tax=Streptomyces sp. NPDC059956 TaxID=3347015 RepID=UPI003660C323